MLKHTISTIALIAALSACAQLPNQNRYGYQDVGQASTVAFGTVIKSREVDITGQNTGIGAGVGIAGGALAGSYVGRGGGSLAGILAGALIAGIAANAAEQAIANQNGIEYIVTEETGQTVTIVQNLIDGEAILKPHQRVMIQQTGMYRRVLPADDLPTEIKRPKRIKVED